MAKHQCTYSADHPEAIADSLFDRRRRILVFGETGIGKSTLITGLSRCLDQNGIRHRILLADPGSPAVGIPGAVCLGRFEDGRFRIMNTEAICSLNAGRFRLPLMEAVGRLAVAENDPVLLIDGPGLTRGIAAAELLTGLITAGNVDTLLMISREEKPAPLTAEWNAAGIEAVSVAASSHARAPSSQQRRRARTALWDAYLSAFAVKRISLSGRPLLGTPPATDNHQQWWGRQIALVEKQRTIAMGEVVAVKTDHLAVRLPDIGFRSKPLLVRDAGRNQDGELVTMTPAKRPSPKPGIWPAGSATVPSIASPGIPIHLGPLAVTLVNGIFGDPLLHLRLPRQKRSLLFDLGEGNRLPARIAHQVSDVFITHAHIDHISGFYWLLRARIGDLPSCRIYGTANLSHHIRGMIQGILWDRIGGRGPCFDITEVDADRMTRFYLQVGSTGAATQNKPSLFHGILVDDPDFTIQGAVLDHNIPVLAMAYEEKPRCHVIESALRQTGYPPGPWLGKLKRRVIAGAHDVTVQLPGGSRQPVSRLAKDLIRIVPGRKMVYATDVADSPANRRKLVDLARGADLFLCEAAYTQAHRHLAMANGHLTARACGEIAAAAGVRRLVPFHLSRRYERHPEPLFAEIIKAGQGVSVVTAVDR
jgi:ribonuclease BN (tRNA processing enzyme)